MRKQAVILCGGKGTRLAPYTTVLPKPLMPVGEDAIVGILIRQLKRDGFEHIIIASGYLSELMESYLGNGERYGVWIEYSREQEPRGTAGPLALIKNLEEQFLMVNGDTLCTLDFEKFYDAHVQSEACATIGTYKKIQKIDLGVLSFDEQGYLKNYIEKPEYTFDISMGIYVLNRSVVDYIPQEGRFDLPDLIMALVRRDMPVKGCRLDGTWYDIGRVEDYECAKEAFLKDPEYFLKKQL